MDLFHYTLGHCLTFLGICYLCIQDDSYSVFAEKSITFLLHDSSYLRIHVISHGLIRPGERSWHEPSLYTMMEEHGLESKCWKLVTYRFVVSIATVNTYWMIISARFFCYFS